MAVLTNILSPVARPILRSLVREYSGDDTTAPLLLLAEVGAVGDNKLRLIYNELLDSGSEPDPSVYSLSGTSETVSSVSISGTIITLTLSGNIEMEDTVLVSYTSPSADPIQDATGNDVADLTNQVVTNNVLRQYLTYINSLTTTPASTIYSDGTYEARKRIVGNAYYIDVGLTALGFDGDENTDWTWVLKYNGQTAVFRSGVRAGDFVVDGTINGTGFAGSEDTDWENHTTAPGGGALTTYRDGIRDQAYVIDKILTGTGFAGAEDTDWENVRNYKPL